MAVRCHRRTNTRSHRITLDTDRGLGFNDFYVDFFVVHRQPSNLVSVGAASYIENTADARAVSGLLVQPDDEGNRVS